MYIYIYYIIILLHLNKLFTYIGTYQSSGFLVRLYIFQYFPKSLLLKRNCVALLGEKLEHLMNFLIECFTVCYIL